MSYSIEMRNEDGSICQVPSHTEGGNIVVGGTTDADMSVTYNYSWFYYKYLDKDKGLRWLYGKTGHEVTHRLSEAIQELGTNRYMKDYWADTPGNAGWTLNVLLDWAIVNPDGFFQGD